MKIYNTLTRRKEEFVPLEAGKVKMYACGITVSGEAHIGHAFQALIYDVFRKFLEKQGYAVAYARNYTDVDDKIIARSRETGIPADRYAAAMIEKIDGVMARAEIGEPTLWLKATENIGNIIAFIRELIEKGHAYAAENGDVYFEVDTCPAYGQLSGRSIEDALDGVRVENDERKKNPYDFALWKAAKAGEICWDSPWGKGRPGWHIECSCISIKHLGENIDIHCGGVDNIFPHHTNEIAQSEAYLGHPWCYYWFHVHHLNDKSGKISKSKGDFLTVQLLESKGYDPLVYRLFCLQSHYRKPLEFSYDVLDNMSAAYDKLVKKIGTLDKSGEVQQDKFEKYKRRFEIAVCDDLNSAMAITVLYNMLKADISDATKYALAEDFDKVLSLNLTTAHAAKEAGNGIEAELEQYILAKIDERSAAKKAKDFAKADAIRAELLEKGIVLEDTREGVKWKKA